MLLASNLLIMNFTDEITLLDMGKDSRSFWDTVDEVLTSMKDDYDKKSVSINQ
jgi:hypothetical protein